jgi:hypothetical protein
MPSGVTMVREEATKIGQVTWAWTEIEAGLAAGMKLKEV